MKEFFERLLEYLPSITSVIACFTAVITCIKTVGSKTKDSLRRISAIKDEVVKQGEVNDEVLKETKETKEEISEIANTCKIQVNETSDALKKMVDLNTTLVNLTEDIKVLKKQYEKRNISKEK